MCLVPLKQYVPVLQKWKSKCFKNALKKNKIRFDSVDKLMLIFLKHHMIFQWRIFTIFFLN